MSFDSAEISIDCFAGGGGASTGIAAALGVSPAIAINHWPTALGVHEANHPETLHLTEDVWAVDPRKVVAGRRVGIAWFSPDCTHFSRAKAGKPRTNKIRGLAWSVVRWAADVAPRVIFVENVPEFQQWGPIHGRHTHGCDGAARERRIAGRSRETQGCRPGCLMGQPIAERRGHTFRAWVRRLERLGYRVDWRVLAACDYGAPTTRRRLYVVARRDGEAPQWPAPSHGPRRALPWRTAAEVIDWSLPVPSIFERKKPLADATLRRIARGIRRFVLESASPFLLHLTHGGRLHPIGVPVPTVTSANRGELAVVAPTLVSYYGGERPRSSSAAEPVPTITTANRHAIVAPYLVHVSNGERPGQAPRIYDIEAPLGTVVAGGIKQGLVTAFLARHFGGRGTPGAPATAPLNTITAQDHHALVAASLVRYQGTGDAEPVERPLGTLTSRDRYGLVAAFLTRFQGTSTGSAVDAPVPTVTGGGEHFGAVTVTIDGEAYAIVDIGMRMLTPRELARAQGFANDYVIERGAGGRPTTRTEQVRLLGNSVCPPVAEALARANAFVHHARGAHGRQESLPWK